MDLSIPSIIIIIIIHTYTYITHLQVRDEDSSASAAIQQAGEKPAIQLIQEPLDRYPPLEQEKVSQSISVW